MDHDGLRQTWEEEHADPDVLPQMDRRSPSRSVKKFVSWLDGTERLSGVEMGCGKGRNCIWLAQQGIDMVGFDFSENAIAEAERRACEAGAENVSFHVHDATERWPFDAGSFDFGIDCMASTDIPKGENRQFVANEFARVIMDRGLLCTYLLSTEDEFHAEMIERYPADEKHSFLHPENGKFEKAFDTNELQELYADFTWLEEQRVEKTVLFSGHEYDCRHFWLVLKNG